MKFNPRSLLLYKKIAFLFLKYAQPAIAAKSGFTHDAEETADGKPEDFAKELEKMGPTFVKLGQLLSTRGDLMPPAYIRALERLQDDVEPVPYDEIREVIEAELGGRISKIFESFDEKPLASASLGQVHEARMRDGKTVIVKVQRPGIGQRIAEDLEALVEVAEWADAKTELGQQYKFARVIDQFRRGILDELDYTLEFQNLVAMGGYLESFENICVPEPVEGLCTAKVLTMEKLDGVKVTELGGVTKTELDGEGLAEELFRAYLHQILIEGHYHSDPHPGNVLVSQEGKVALIDLGMVGRLSSSFRDRLFGLLTAISEQDADRVADIALKLSDAPVHDVSKVKFVGELADLLGKTDSAKMTELQFGTVVMEIMRICADQGIVIPQEFSLLGKTLLNLDRVGLALAPHFDPSDAVKRNLRTVARRRSLDSLKEGSFTSLALEMKELIAQTPNRVNELLSVLAENRLRIDVDAIDEKALISGFQKIANRVALGAIIGAMIIGASLMMNIESETRIFGYPAFPMALFIAAAIFGLFFVVTIVRNDD